MTDSVPALQTIGLVAGYERDLPIVRGIDLAVARGEFVGHPRAQWGRQINLCQSARRYCSVFCRNGSARWPGHRTTPVHLRSGKGLGFVPQTENIFTSLSIAENLQLAADVLPKALRRSRLEQTLSRFPDLAARPKLRAGQLSGGQRQMLAVARALVVEPQVLILDEPSAGLSPKTVGTVFAMLKEINSTGVTVILVEQNVKAALSVVERGVILVEGQLRHQGRAEALVNDPMLAALYLGAHAPQVAQR